MSKKNILIFVLLVFLLCLLAITLYWIYLGYRIDNGWSPYIPRLKVE